MRKLSKRKKSKKSLKGSIKKGRKGKGNKVLNYVNRLEEAYADKSYTFVQDLEEDGVISVFPWLVKDKIMSGFPTRYVAAKLLINAKISLASLLYDCVDTYCFPSEKAQAIYARHQIIKVLPYLLMTDTDSGSVEFIIIAEDSCDCGERKMRDILLKIILDNDIHKWLDLSNEFFEQFNKRNKLLERSSVSTSSKISNTELLPQGYLEVYGILFNFNKKHKGVKRGTKGYEL